MNIEEIKSVVNDQKGELEKAMMHQRIIKREVLDHYQKYMDTDIIKVITGIRRCGKSTFAGQLLKGKKFAYLNFDDERLLGLDYKALNNVLEVFYEIYGDFTFVFLDEIQNVKGWELFVNRLRRQGYNVIITGSNANLLSAELATHLTGRYINFELYPFSFKEFIDYRGKSRPFKKPTTRERAFLKRSLNEFTGTGGFPEVLKEGTIFLPYLQTLYNTIVTKDVVLRHSVRHIKTLKNIATYIITNYSRMLSFNRIRKAFNLKSTQTVLNYIMHLEESHLFFFINRISAKLTESLNANRKAYCIDTGLINALSFKISENNGPLLENLVAIELLRRGSIEKYDIYYWRNRYGHEVDFVIKQGLKVSQLIQVCCHPDNPDVRKREIRALLLAGKELKCKDLLLINQDRSGTEKVENRTIRFLPMWEWLLNN